MWFSQKKKRKYGLREISVLTNCHSKNCQSLSLESIFLPEPSIRASCNAI